MKILFDTCSLLDLQEGIFNFDGDVLISSISLVELENIKTSYRQDESIKYTARQLLNLLEEKQGQYEIILYKTNWDDLLIANNYLINNDSRIIATGHYNLGCEDLFVTSDLACKKLAEALGLTTRFNCTEPKEDYLGYKEIKFNDDELAKLYGEYIPNNNNYFKLLTNEYLLIKNDKNEIIDKYAWNGHSYKRIGYQKLESKMFGKITAKNDDPYQQLAMYGLMNSQFTLLRGSAGTGKAQPNSTLIPTRRGKIKLGNLKVGDKVFNRYGVESTVLGVYPQGKIDNYEIVFSDGRKAYCNDEHIWSCYTSRGNLKDFTVKEMLDLGLKTKSGIPRFRIPLNYPIEYKKRKFEIDPYVMGVFIGDGQCLKNELTLATKDDFIIEEVAKLIKSLTYRKSNENTSNWFYHTIIKGYATKREVPTRIKTRIFFKNYLNEVVQEPNYRRIPEEYKYGSIEQRLSLLQGLLDSDGTIDNDIKGRVRFSSCNLDLIHDIQEICWSLGFKTGLVKDNRKERYLTGVHYILSIKCPKDQKPNLFRTPKKKQIAINYANNDIKQHWSGTLSITEINKMPKKEEMTCIIVNNLEHLYLTQDYIVTHNTLLSLSSLFTKLEQGTIDRIIMFVNPIASRGAAKLGFYPGSRNEKLMDSTVGGILVSKIGDRIYVEKMLEDGILMLIPYADLRGFDSTGMRAGILVTEAQNLDRNLMKLGIQRVGEDCCLIVEGDDFAQTDMSLYSGKNNGMKKAIEVFKGQKCFNTIKLKNIYRSDLANIAEKI